jgi:predicted phosphodiesterase
MNLYLSSIVLTTMFVFVLFTTHHIYAAENPSGNTIPIDNSLNIAVASDWGCTEDTKKTSQNIQGKNPELVIAPGDLSYEKSADCWTNIISPFKSKLMISMGDHEYQDTKGGESGIMNNYLNPLALSKTYYAYDFNNVHFIAIDPYVDYTPGSSQYNFIENDLKTASTNPKIDWIFVMEHVPIYTSTTEHPSDSTIRDVFHPLFEEYGVDIVFSGDNHNYQRTFPLKYNNDDGDSSNPISSSTHMNNYKENSGIIFLTSGTAGKSHYEIEQQAPYVAAEDDEHFGFLNIDITDKMVKGTFYANENEKNKKDYAEKKDKSAKYDSKRDHKSDDKQNYDKEGSDTMIITNSQESYNNQYPKAPETDKYDNYNKYQKQELNNPYPEKPENEPNYYDVGNQNNAIDNFTISKIKEVSLLTSNKKL